MKTTPRESATGSDGPLDLRLQQRDAADWAEAAGSEWLDAAALYRHMVENTNHVLAAERFPWESVLARRATVLDLGCGAGWLTALVSRFPNVDRVVAVDSSRRLLAEVFPEVVELAGGAPRKIETVCAEFAPLPFDDESFDVVVMSSAFHHAASPGRVLDECRRVLRGGGAVVLLNELPYPVPAMLRYVATTAAAAAVNAVTTRVTLRKRGHVAADHVLYDEVLGDRAMTSAQWRRLFANHGFRADVIDSGLPAYKPTFRPPYRFEKSLTHFVLRPAEP